MARPFTEGLPYFSLDTAPDEKWRALDDIHGNDGFAVLIKMWQLIYRTSAGELNCSEKNLRISYAKHCHLTVQKWEKIIKTAISLELFDKSPWEVKKILTSNGVKKRVQKVKDDREAARLRALEKAKNKALQGSSANNHSNTRKTPLKGKEKESEKETGSAFIGKKIGDVVEEMGIV